MLVVIATATRKSMLFMLPTKITLAKVIVVIALLNALQDNLVDYAIS
jgi:hypothetical protein